MFQNNLAPPPKKTKILKIRAVATSNLAKLNFMTDIRKNP